MPHGGDHRQLDRGLLERTAGGAAAGPAPPGAWIRPS